MRGRLAIAASLVVLAAGIQGTPALGATGSPTWTKVGSYAPPVVRYGHAMARDATGRTIVFGGLTTGTLGVEADTWRWSGTRWSRLAPPVSPPERSFAALAYDPVRKETVLFGGYGGATGTLADTWAWDGQTWTQRAPALSPPPRGMGEMAWDAATQKLVLFGGSASAVFASAPLGDTWSWDGTQWAVEPAAVSPPPRWGFGFADGGATSKPTLFGGTPDGLTGEVFLGDTWTWDGPGHTWLPAAVTGPSGRAGTQMAFDPARGNVVLHGGYARPQGNPLGQENFADTWIWDGTAWARRTPARSPWFTTRFQSALAYDGVDQRVRVFGGLSCTPGLFGGGGCLGGYTNDTWGWDGATWHPEDLTAPNEMQKPMLARDPLRGAVAFGGQYEYGNYSQETWRWNDGEWEALAPEHRPLPRGMAAMTYFPKTETTIMFGGNVDTLGLPGTRKIYESNDTWSWDGTEWTELQPATSPPPRSEAMIAYDPVREEVVLFGGGLSGYAKDDTWVWDGADWTQKQPAVSPPARIAGSMAYDPLRGEMVLFGGMMSKNTGYHADTWVWDGQSWTEILTPPGGSPPARSFGGMGWDPSTGTVIYFGGCSNCYANPTYDETWSWDGTSWTELSPASAPERRTSFAMLSGDGDNPLLLFGGRRAVLTPQGGLAAYPEGTNHTNEVWEFGS